MLISIGSPYLQGTVPLSLFSHRTYWGDFQIIRNSIHRWCFVKFILSISMYRFGILDIFFPNTIVASPMLPLARKQNSWNELLKDSGLLPFVSLFTELFCYSISLVSREGLIYWKRLENHLGRRSVLLTPHTQLALQETDGFADIIKWSPS